MKYFLIVATADHVGMAVKDGFAQAGHGRLDHISKLAKGDGVVYYSHKDKMEGGKALQQFTAIGHVADEAPYNVKVSDTFKPYRRDIKYLKAKSTNIKPLIPHLSFIKNKDKWGFYLMGGFKEISKEDFEVIKGAMM